MIQYTIIMVYLNLCFKIELCYRAFKSLTKEKDV